MQLIDFHCHLDLYPNFVDLLKECEDRQIYTLAVTTTPRAWLRNKNLTTNTKFVKAALGLHPQLVEESSWRSELELWEKYLIETKYIGEVGIDGSRNYINTLPLQEKVFSRVLELACAHGNKVLSVHSLNSSKKVLDMIEKELPEGKGIVVLHWFTGSTSDAKRAIELGCYFSINPKMLITKKGQELITMLPTDRLLSETDGPFVSLNGKKIVPKDVGCVLDGIAKIKQLPTPQIQSLIVKNYKMITS